MEHSFIRCKENLTCGACGGKWNCHDGSKSIFQCTKCGLNCHGDCRSFAKSCLPCSTERNPSVIEVGSGHISIRFIHLYDIPILQGTSIYGSISMRSSASDISDEVHGRVITSSENECIWTDNTLESSAIVIPLSSKSNFDPELLVKVYSSSMYGFFDSPIASCSISVTPLIKYPSKEVERWFLLKATDSDAIGRISLNVRYIPSISNKSASNLSNPSTSQVSNDDWFTSMMKTILDEHESQEKVPADGSKCAPIIPSSDPVSTLIYSNDVVKHSCISEINNKPGILVTVQNDSAKLEPVSPTKILNADKPSPRRVSESINADSSVSTGVSTYSVKDNIVNTTIEKRASPKVTNTVTFAAKGTPDKPVESRVISKTTNAVLLNPNRLCNVGKLYVHIESAHRGDVEDAGEGNYYVVVECVEGNLDYHTSNPPEQRPPIDPQELKSSVVMQTPVKSSGLGVLSPGLQSPEIISQLPLRKRTRVVYGSASPIFEEKFELIIPHYMYRCKLTLFDSVSDTEIGSTHYFSMYGLMQRDADFFNSKSDDVTLLNYPIFSKDVKYKHEDSSSVYYPDCTLNKCDFIRSKLVFKENLEQLYYCAEPLNVPPPPLEQFSIDRLGVHIARFKNAFAVLAEIQEEYNYLVSWKDPVLTGTLFMLFLVVTLKLNAEYALSVPAFLLLALMTAALLQRKSGQYRRKWIQLKGDNSESNDLIAKNENASSSFLTLRCSVTDQNILCQGPSPPFYYVKFSLIEGNNQSTSLIDSTVEHVIALTTIAGRDSCKIGSAIPLNSSGDFLSQMLSSFSLFGVGNRRPKEEMLWNTSDPWSRDEPAVDGSTITDISYLYPILLPAPSKSGPTHFQLLRKYNEMIAAGDPIALLISEVKTKNAYAEVTQLWKWMQIRGFVRVSVFKKESLEEGILGTFGLGTDYTTTTDLGGAECFGVVNISISHMLESILRKYLELGKETKEFPLIGKILGDSKLDTDPLNTIEIHDWFDLISASTNGKLVGKVKLRLKFDDLCSLLDSRIDKVEMKTSKPSVTPTARNVTDLRAEFRRKRSSKSDIIINNSEEAVKLVDRADVWRTLLYIFTEISEASGQSTISAIWNIRSYVAFVQNIANSILNYFECTKNLMNWTLPDKTYYVYCCLIALWICTCIIPGRYLILLVGLYEFLYAFFPEPEIFPWSIRFLNLLFSVPNDDELGEIYKQEQSGYKSTIKARENLMYRRAKLRLMMPCLWEGSVYMKGMDSHSSKSGKSVSQLVTGISVQSKSASDDMGSFIACHLESEGRSLSSEWKCVYLVLQGHRLVWWNSESEIDDCIAPQSQLLLYGIAGVTMPSPVDIREVGKSLESSMLAVFGRALDGSPMKCTIICHGHENKLNLLENLQTACQ